MSKETIDNHLLSVLNYAMDGMVTFRSDGVIEFFNTAAEQIFGYSQIDVYGKNINLLFPELKNVEPENLINYFKNKTNNKAVTSSEIIAQHQSGKIFSLELSFGEIQLPMGYVYWGIFRDITEVKRNEQNLHNTNIILDCVSLALSQFIKDKSQEKITEIFKSFLLDIATVTKSVKGFIARFRSESASNLELLATIDPLWEGEINTILVDNKGLEISLEAIKPYIEKIIESKSFLIENHININGLETPISFLGVPLINKEQLVGVTVLCSHLTDYSIEMMQLLIPVMQACVILIEGYENELTRLATEKKLKRSLSELELINEELKHANENALMASQAKSSFLANMSHEIRTPLNGIMGMTELLLYTELNERQKKYAETVYHSSEVLLALVNDILDLSKIEANELKLEVIESSIETVTKDVISLLFPKAQEKGIELLVYFSPDFPLSLKCDPMRVRQVMTNLIYNAIKFTEKGYIKVVLKVLEQSHTTTTIRFEVIDSGIGISQEEMKKLFTKFSQADTSTTRKYGGSGLGLSICKKLIERMNGKIGVESEKGKGSIFWFEVSFANGKNTSKQEKMLKDVPVMVVGGSDLENEALMKCFDDWKMQSTVCPSLEEAIAKLQENKSKKCFIISGEKKKENTYEQMLSDNMTLINIVDEMEVQSDHKTSLEYVFKPLYPDELYKTLVNHLNK